MGIKAKLLSKLDWRGAIKWEVNLSSCSIPQLPQIEALRCDSSGVGGGKDQVDEWKRSKEDLLLDEVPKTLRDLEDWGMDLPIPTGAEVRVPLSLRVGYRGQVSVSLDFGGGDEWEIADFSTGCLLSPKDLEAEFLDDTNGGDSGLYSLVLAITELGRAFGQARYFNERKLV